MTNKPVVLLVNSSDTKLKKIADRILAKNPFIDAKICYEPQSLAKTLVQYNPTLIVSFLENCESSFYEILNSFDLSINKKWMEYRTFSEIGENEIQEICNTTLELFVDKQQPPTFSICVPTYKANVAQIQRIYISLATQTFHNWELILFDTNSNFSTIYYMETLMLNDPRVHLYRDQYSRFRGNIGGTKHMCFSLAKGEYLIELDHDDELVPYSLALIKAVIAKNNEPDFLYTDCWERYENTNTTVDYGKLYAFGLGKQIEWNSEIDEELNPYDLEFYNQTPEISSTSLHHIVSVPNHARIWKRSFYHSIGGHNEYLSIADDYELILRTFIHTTKDIVHIQAPLYVQNMHSSNSQDDDRDFIQKLVQKIWLRKNEEISKKLIELGQPKPEWFITSPLKEEYTVALNKIVSIEEISDMMHIIQKS